VRTGLRLVSSLQHRHAPRCSSRARTAEGHTTPPYSRHRRRLRRSLLYTHLHFSSIPLTFPMPPLLRPNPVPLLNICRQVDARGVGMWLQELSKRIGWETRQIERWWRRRRSQGKLSELQRFRETRSVCSRYRAVPVRAFQPTNFILFLNIKVSKFIVDTDRICNVIVVVL